jgi:thiol-disulfide isomerase/thioredoxin
VRRAAIFASMLVMGESSVSGNGVLTVRCVRFYHAGVTHRRLVVAALAFSTLLAACTSPPAPAPVHITLPASPEALPLVNAAGYRQLLTQLHGTPVVVNVWASWCGPCITEAPLLHQAAADHPNMQFLGVDILDTKDGAAGFIQKYAISYPSVFNPTGDIRDSLGLLGQPHTLFYDASGALRATVSGPLGQEDLDQDLAKISS